jgi:hypothetical protein
MNIMVPMRTGTQAFISFSPLDRRFRLNLRVQGERPRTNGVEPDLHFHIQDGGVLTLLPAGPITASPNGQEWNCSYRIERSQLMLLAIYPVTRMRSDPWTGGEGVPLDRGGLRDELMALARSALGIDFAKVTP